MTTSSYIINSFHLIPTIIKMALLSLVNQNDTSLTLISFILALFSFFLIRAIRRSYHHNSKLKNNTNLPPSPPKLPIIGNLHQLGTLPHRSFQSLYEKYGPIFFLQLGQTPTVVVSSPELASEVMKTHDLALADRPQLTGPQILLYGSTDVGFGLYGENWRQKKKICVNELLSLKRVQSFKQIREEEGREMVNKIRKVSLSGQSSVNLSEVLTASANDIVCKCVFGDKFNTEGSARFGELARKVMVNLAAISVGDFLPFLSWIDVVNGHIPRMKALFKELDEFFDQLIQDHKNRAVYKGDHDQFVNSSKSLVGVVLQLQQDDMIGYNFTQDDIKSILMDMFIGGTDTTSTTLEWAMTELARNPTKLKKAQKEVRSIVGNKSKIDENDIDKMSYLKCVIKESLRLHPPSTLVPPRLARSNVELNGYTIPTKTMVYINSWVIQRDPKYWERPEEFWPERFEKNDVDMRGQDFRLIPFGSGRRGCPGWMFGIAAVECMLANLLYWFDWKLPNNVASVEDIDMSEVFGLTTTKKVPLYLRPIPFSYES